MMGLDGRAWRFCLTDYFCLEDPPLGELSPVVLDSMEQMDKHSLGSPRRTLPAV